MHRFRIYRAELAESDVKDRMGKQKEENALLTLNEQTFPIVEQITSRMPGGFFIYHADGNGEIIYANQSLFRMYSCSNLEEFKAHTGYTFRGLVHPNDWERVDESIRSQVEERDGFDYVEYQIVRRDGAVRWIEDFGRFVHTDTFGDVFYVFVDDATERHQKEQLVQERLCTLERLEHETTALRIVHEIIRSGMWTMEFDKHGNMVSVFWSEEFRRMLGYQDESDFPNVLESWSNLLHPEDKERVLTEYYDTINDYTGKKEYNVEYRLLTKDRGYRWYRASGKLSRQADGTPITYVGIFVDITKRKELDRALREQRNLLEEALRQAQRSNEAKTTFLNNMSHDLRTPMNAIIGFTTLASTHLDNTELVRDYLSKILASSDHLLTLLNDVLDMSSIESGKLHIEELEYSLPDIVYSLKTILQSEIEIKKLNFLLKVDVIHEHIVCDKLRLTQVLLNVAGNSVKFTPSGGTVKVCVTEKPGAPEGYAFYEFCIQDTGIGMGKEFLPHIFEPFEREQTSTISGIQGTGLGMSITKSIVNMMNGSITVDSEKEKGTQFTISFTFRLSGNQQGTPRVLDQRLPKNAFQGKHILLVEDNALNQEIAVTILTEAGFQVDTADNGAIAVEKVRNSAPGDYDLILMDIQMPVMDGYEATRQIKALDDPKLASIPIVAVTANAFEEDKQRSLNAGMVGHLGKPLEISKLTKALHGILH